MKRLDWYVDSGFVLFEYVYLKILVWGLVVVV